MSNTNPERNLEVTNIIPLPKSFSDLVSPVLDDDEQQKLLQVSLQLGLLIASEKESKYYFRLGQDMTRIKMGPLGDQRVDEEGIPYFDFNQFLYSVIEDVINPRQDSSYLANHLRYNDDTPIQLANQHIQDEARDLVAEVADKVKGLIPSHIEAEIQITLEKAKQGVLVVKDLSRIEDPTFLIRTPKILNNPFLSLEGTFILEVHGAVIRPYNAILLDEGIFTNKGSTKAEKLHTATHEVLHLISDGNLPDLLDEGATDYYAQNAIGVDIDAKNLAGVDHRLAYDLWRYLERQVGEAIAWQAYMEPAVFRVVRDKDTKEEVLRSYTGLKLHDLMRQILDGKGIGESKWDTVLGLIQVERMLPATDLIYPLGLRIRSRINYLNQFFR